MPTDTTPAPEPRFSIVEESVKPRLDWRIWFPFAVLVVVGLIGMFLVSLFVDNERDQAKTEWRTRMGIVADSRAADINRWLGEGRLKANISRVMPVAQAAAAHKLQEENTLQKAGTLAGKIVLKP